MVTLYMLEIRCADQLTKHFPRFTLADLYTLKADVDAKIAEAEAAGDKVEVEEPFIEASAEGPIMDPLAPEDIPDLEEVAKVQKAKSRKKAKTEPATT